MAKIRNLVEIKVFVGYVAGHDWSLCTIVPQSGAADRVNHSGGRVR